MERSGFRPIRKHRNADHPVTPMFAMWSNTSTNPDLKSKGQLLRIRMGVTLQRTPVRMPGHCGDLVYPETFLKPTGNRLMSDRQDIENGNFLKSIIEYDPDTGLFKWKARFHGGRRAGTVTREGYIRINIGCMSFKAHRLAWIMHYGVVPEPGRHMDHINGDKTDNRICNLRVVGSKENQENRCRPKSNTSGFKGVAKCKGRYRAYISHNRKQIHLGVFATPEEAHAAYCKAAKDLGWTVHRTN